MFWDRVAWIYDIFANIINRKVHKKLCMDVAALFSSEDEVLECACGTGMLTVHIAPRCKRIVATDLSENMLKKTRKKCATFDNVHCEKTDIINLPYADDIFDVVLAANVIHLLPSPEKAVAEMRRVCRPGGRLIIPTYVVIPGGDANRCTRNYARRTDADSGEANRGDACGREPCKSNGQGIDCCDADKENVCTNGIKSEMLERNRSKNLNPFSKIIGKMGAGFQRQFTPDGYRAFFREMGYEDAEYFVLEGRLPCAVAVIRVTKK